MKQEEILDHSLNFLSKNDEGSFSYYRNEEKSIKFLQYLKDINVEQKDWLKTIIHLVNDGYLEVNPELSELKGDFPNQIKITSQGKIFIKRGGYNRELKQEKKSNRRFWIPILISAIALIFSILSFMQNYNSNHPDISLTNDKLISTVFNDTLGQKQFFGFQRATITNNGGKPVTLRSFIPHKNTGLILLTEKGSNKISENNVNYKIFLIPDSLTSETIFSNVINLSSFDNQGLEKLSMINKVIMPGEVYTISLGIVVDVFSNSKKSYSSIIVSGQLFFSNGQYLDFGSAGNIK